VLVACGSGDGGGSADQEGSGVEVDQVVVPDAGPPMLPPADSAALAGLGVDLVRGPEDVDAQVAEQLDRYGGPGRLALYGDPSVADPFDRPWALAIRHQGSENSELGALSADGLPLAYVDVPVEQLSQETLRAGVLASEVADVEALAAGLLVGGGADGPGTVEIDAQVLDAAPERLELLTSGDLDLGLLGIAADESLVAPFVRWSSPRGMAPYRRVSVSSYAADAGLELLLRATMGGRHVGPIVMPVAWADGPVAAGVRTVDETTVLVQALSTPADQIEQLLGELQPADGERFDELVREHNTRDELPYGISDAAAVARGEALGGVWTVAVEVRRAYGPFGEFDSCMLATAFDHPTGSYGGPQGSGPCSEFGSFSTTTDAGLGATFVAGEVPPDVARLVVTLDDGSVHEPTLAVGQRRPFGIAVGGVRSVVGAQTYDAVGQPLHQLAV